MWWLGDDDGISEIRGFEPDYEHIHKLLNIIEQEKMNFDEIISSESEEILESGYCNLFPFDWPVNIKLMFQIDLLALFNTSIQ